MSFLNVHGQTYIGGNIGLEVSEIKAYQPFPQWTSYNTELLSKPGYNRKNAVYNVCIEHNFLKHLFVNVQTSLSRQQYEIYPGCFDHGATIEFNRWDGLFFIGRNFFKNYEIGIGIFGYKIYSMDGISHNRDMVVNYPINYKIKSQAYGFALNSSYTFNNFRFTVQYLICLKAYTDQIDFKEINSFQFLVGYVIKIPAIHLKTLVHCPTFKKTMN